MPVSFYLGIDGGGTKTSCVVGNEESVLATATAGPSNVVRIGEAEARRSLAQAVRQACAAAGISPKEVSRTCIGAAGAARSEIAAGLHSALSEIVSGEIVVTGDMQIALEAAFPGAPGIVVIAGTGSIAYGRNADGSTARAGGRGFAVSDEGSAYWIGRNAVAALLRAWDRSPENVEQRREGIALLDALKSLWNVHSLDDLVRAANAIPPPDFAALLPAVIAGAESGDEISGLILTRASAELAEIGAVLLRRLYPQEGNSSPVRVATAGGVFRYSDAVRRGFYNELKSLYQNVEIFPGVIDPVQGALHIARKGSV